MTSRSCSMSAIDLETQVERESYPSFLGWNGDKEANINRNK